MSTNAERFALAVRHHRDGALGPASDLCRQVLEADPYHAAAWHLLGAIAHELGRHEKALEFIGQALALEPAEAVYHSNLAEVCRLAGKLQAAVAHGREAVRLAPGLAEARHNLGLALLADGLAAEAAAQFSEAIRLKPPFAVAHLDRALAWQMLGDLEQGWREYEWRWQCPEFPPRSFPQPRWDGGPLAGRTILVHAEQGLGDTLQFVRYAALLKQRGATVLVECPPPLLGILACCPGIDGLFARGTDLPAFDVHVPLLSLPASFGTTLGTVPAPVPYVFAVRALVARWRLELEAINEYKIGIVWQGSRSYRWDRFRSIPLAEFAPLAQLEGVRLFSLQKGDGTDQLGTVAQRWPICDLGARLDLAAGPFMDTAAVLGQLDLVIAPDTALAHLAGALGAPIWLALARTAEPRWLLHREDSPWYPTMRLFRQRQLGNWADVFQRMQEELRKLLAARRAEHLPAGPLPRGGLLVELAPGELIDKITILEIKNQRITVPAKLDNVRRELAMLRAVQARAMAPSPELARLTAELKRVNEALWQIEDDIRWCERREEFGEPFVALARSIYVHNDRRGALKRQINEMLGSSLLEEKAYTAYQG